MASIQTGAPVAPAQWPAPDAVNTRPCRLVHPGVQDARSGQSRAFVTGIGVSRSVAFLQSFRETHRAYPGLCRRGGVRHGTTQATVTGTEETPVPARQGQPHFDTDVFR
jgi:hypothetical protein